MYIENDINIMDKNGNINILSTKLDHKWFIVKKHLSLLCVSE